MITQLVLQINTISWMIKLRFSALDFNLATSTSSKISPSICFCWKVQGPGRGRRRTRRRKSSRRMRRMMRRMRMWRLFLLHPCHRALLPKFKCANYTLHLVKHNTSPEDKLEMASYAEEPVSALI